MFTGLEFWAKAFVIEVPLCEVRDEYTSKDKQEGDVKGPCPGHDPSLSLFSI